MRKIIIVLTCLSCALISLFALLYLFGYPPFYYAASLTISEVHANPEFWVNKKVCVQGVLSGPLIYIPEEVPPYNYALRDPKNGESIGILWRDHSIDFNENVTVIGL